VSVQAMSWVIEKSRHKGSSFVILLMTANHAKADGTGAWPSVRTLARESRISERQARNCLRRLEESGELKTDDGAGPGGTNLYSLPLMGVEKLDMGGKRLPPGVGKSAAKNVSQIAPEPSLTVQSQSQNLRPLMRPACGNLEPDDSGKIQNRWLGKGKGQKETTATPQQQRFAIVARLAKAAAEILNRKPDLPLGDLAEELKQWAANEGVPYFDAWPGAATPIEQAITIATERRKTA
jgi:hypothetical protein